MPDSDLFLRQIDASHSWQQRTDFNAKPERKLRGELVLLDFRYSYRTNSLFLLFNAERSLKVVTFHIRTSAGRVGSPPPGGIRSSEAVRPPRWHRASHRDLREDDAQGTTVIRASVAKGTLPKSPKYICQVIILAKTNSWNHLFYYQVIKTE